MQKENFGKGVTIGQRIGLSFCDELKLRRFYAEPGIRGRKQCELWSPRCRTLSVTRESEVRVAGRASVGITKAGHQRDSTKHSAKV